MVDKKAELAAQQIKTATTSAGKPERDTAAADLAALVKASGSSAVLVSYGILDKLQKAAEDKKSAPGKEGAAAAYTALATTLAGLPLTSEPALLRALPVVLVEQGTELFLFDISTPSHCSESSDIWMGGWVDGLWKIQNGSRLCLCCLRPGSLDANGGFGARGKF
ncbi:hypothetical protein BC830DRAFT_630175 [Chytriomyces sp. MP71]|nr:hypothetical protein BC830DRAFT_630175 [Chytriomyces sp. MP71]